MADWTVGDLALCVRRMPISQIECGQVFTVSAIVLGGPNSLDSFGLEFVGKTSFRGCGYRVHFFRRIPPHTPDAEDHETIRLLNGEPALAARLALEFSRAGIEGDGE